MARRHGLSWMWLLVVIVFIALFIGYLLPSRGGRGRPNRVLCMLNLKQQGIAFAIYAQENGGQWPNSKSSLGSLCEQTIETRDALAGAMTGTSPATVQKIFYCPNNAAQDPAKLWNAGGVSTWGYAWLNDRGPAGAALPAEFPARSVPLQYHSNLNKIRQLNNAVLALDVIVTDTDAPPLNYTPKGVTVTFGTNHMPTTPSTNYQNVLFLDGHADSVKFDPKKAVAVKQPGGGYFWFPNP